MKYKEGVYMEELILEEPLKILDRGAGVDLISIAKYCIDLNLRKENLVINIDDKEVRISDITRSMVYTIKGMSILDILNIESETLGDFLSNTPIFIEISSEILTNINVLGMRSDLERFIRDHMEVYNAYKDINKALLGVKKVEITIYQAIMLLIRYVEL